MRVIKLDNGLIELRAREGDISKEVIMYYASRCMTSDYYRETEMFVFIIEK